MTSILVTGGTGSFGKAFAKVALARGVGRICIYSRGELKQAEMREEFDSDPRLRFFIGDVRDRDRLRRAMEGCEVVVHAAALKRIEVGHYDPIEMCKTNVNGTINVIEAAQDAAVKKVVFLSTDKAYQPVSPYGHSKALAEALILNANNNRGAYGPLFSACRYGNIWGANGSVVPRWRSMIERGAKSVPVTDPDCTRFFMKLEDAVDLVISTIETMEGGELAIPELPAYSIGDLVSAFGVDADIRGLPTYEKLHESMCDGRCSADARRMTVSELKGVLNG